MTNKINKSVNFKNSIKTKRIIAREFLFLISCLFIVLITFVSILVYNKYLEKKITDNEKTINKIRDNPNPLTISYNNKIEQQTKFVNNLYFFLNNKRITITADQRNKLWRKLCSSALHDSIDFKWTNKWRPQLTLPIEKQGFNTPSKFKNFILENTPTEKEFNSFKKENITVYQAEMEITNLKNKKSDYNKDLHYILINTLLFSFLILFILRYIFIGIMWSFRILRE